MGFGTGPFGLGPYGTPASVPATEPVTTAVSCRSIDGVTRDYVTDADGNPVAEDGTANRVYMLLSYADQTQDIITPQGLKAREAGIRDALSPLASGAQPAIKDLVVSVTDNGGSGVAGTVSYFNLATQQPVTLRIT